MKLLFFFLTFLSGNCIGQSIDKIFLNDTLPDGTIVNKLDENGLQHGLYVLPNFYGHTKPFKADFLDMECNGYEMGHYEHGCPVGKWILRQSNGFRSEGEYHCTIKPEEVNFRKKKGKDFQIGVWTIYNPDNSIYYRKKEDYKFDGKKWTFLYYLQKRNDTVFYLSTSHQSNTIQNKYTNWKKGVYEDKKFNEDGILIQEKYHSPKKRYIREYNANGRIKTDQTAWYGRKGRKIFIEKEYFDSGKIAKNKRTKGQPKLSWHWCGTRSESFF